MRFATRALVFVCTTWLTGICVTHAQTMLTPPMGLKWCDSPEKLITWAHAQAFDVTISLPADKPTLRILKIKTRKGVVAGLEASEIEGRFLSGQLYEVTFHYEADVESSADRMNRQFLELKQQVTSQYGELTANQQQRSMKDQFVTRTQAFHREPVRGLFILLALTEIEDALRKTSEAKFSLVYRNDNLRQQLEKAAASPPPP